MLCYSAVPHGDCLWVWGTQQEAPCAFPPPAVCGLRCTSPYTPPPPPPLLLLRQRLYSRAPLSLYLLEKSRASFRPLLNNNIFCYPPQPPSFKFAHWPLGYVIHASIKNSFVSALRNPALPHKIYNSYPCCKKNCQLPCPIYDSALYLKTYRSFNGNSKALLDPGGGFMFRFCICNCRAAISELKWPSRNRFRSETVINL
jgi:hypothetical protein